MHRSSAAWVLAALASSWLAACPAPDPGGDKIHIAPAADTTLGIGDTFDVRVFGEQELTGTYRVGAEGTITFPLAGEIRVIGLDPQSVARAIADRLKQGFMRNPQVTVLAKDVTSKKIYALGQLVKPGTYTYAPSMSVIDAISLAGGFTPLAAKNDVLITRTDNGQKLNIKVPVEDISSGKAKNVYLIPGDIISVPERLF